MSDIRTTAQLAQDFPVDTVAHFNKTVALVDQLAKSGVLSGAGLDQVLDSISAAFAYLNPLAPPAPPVPTAGGTGGPTARTEYFKITLVTANGETLPSTEASVALTTGQLSTVPSPAAVGSATGYKVYGATAAGAEKLQTPVPVTIGVNWVEPTSGLTTTGAVPPTKDTSGAGLNLLETFAAPVIATVGTAGSTTLKYACVPRYPIVAGDVFHQVHSLPGADPAGAYAIDPTTGLPIGTSKGVSRPRIKRFVVPPAPTAIATANAVLSASNYVNVIAPAVATVLGVTFDILKYDASSTLLGAVAVDVAAGSVTADKGAALIPYAPPTLNEAGYDSTGAQAVYGPLTSGDANG